jgi:Domain of unknown function (DUF6378)
MPSDNMPNPNSPLNDPDGHPPVNYVPGPVSTEALLNERDRTHGDWKTHAYVTQMIKEAMASAGEPRELTPSHREALSMIAHKIGRIVCGDPNHKDHWDDIAGYATLVAKNL